ncbi:MAG: hypothetical protein IJA61_01915 [Clostridia bacterium]|nr:hypothetical protein [Clostridia bacterium]
MNSKTKIAISAIGIVMVLAIIGLTIGLVLVAQQAQVGNTMKVTYEANNVACTIVTSAADANGVVKVDGEDSVTDKFYVYTEGTDVDGTTVATSNHVFADAVLTVKKAANSDAAEFTSVTYTFVVTNDHTTSGDVTGKSITASVSYVATGTDTNVTITCSEDATITAGQNATLTVVVTGVNVSADALANGTIKVVVENA